MNINAKKIIKIVSVLLLIMMAFAIIQPVFADSNMLTPAELQNKITYGNSSELQKKAGAVMGLIRNVAVILGVIMLMVLGVKYMLGSAEEKADYKKSLMPLVIGIIVVMAATQIAAMVVDFIDK